MAFSEELAAVYGGRIITEEPMYKHTSLGLGGKAEYYLRPKTEREAVELLTLAEKYALPVMAVGRGSNLLVGDKGIRGMVLSTERLDALRVNGETVTAYAGVKNADLIEQTRQAGLTGLEFLAGIPGSVGGGIVMNAGAFGKSLSDAVQSVDVIRRGRHLRLSAEACAFTYRGSGLSEGDFILSARFRLERSSPDRVEALIAGYLEQRRRLQPAGKTCGSVFRNPEGASAGALIERAGLKGARVGGASVSLKHANFIVNEGTCAKDVLTLIGAIKNKIKEEFGVTLREEVVIVGEFE
ncbi:MAG: UDP-N-acetylmuramate dehydrogenase [Firmicutes bacterium]|nr:UDP-N-acetylmuramate dehydrogenase [Bacillota bacterium]